MVDYCVNSFFDEIGSCAGKKDKIACVKKFLDREIPEFVYATKLALDPFIRFGFKKMPTIDESVEGTKDFKDVIPMLNILSTMNHSKESENLLVKILSEVKPSERMLVKRIVLKDPRCGMQIATWNKAIEGREYEEQAKVLDYPCMLASPFSEKLVNKLPWDEGVICQEKCDGMRFNAITNGSRIQYFGRSGKPLTIKSDAFEHEIRSLACSLNVAFDGELLVLDENGNVCDRKTGNGILNKAVRGTITKEESERIIFVVWDMIPTDHFMRGYSEEPFDYQTRFHRLANLFVMMSQVNETPFTKIRLVRTEIIHFMDEANEMFKEITDQGGEGVILKNPHNIWKNVRSTEQIKMKLELDADLRIVDLEEGTGKYEGMLGAMLLESDDGKVCVSVGTGFSDEQRKAYFDRSIVGKIATIVYNSRIKDKNRPNVDSLFLPRFIELREDKTETNSSEQIK